MAKIRFGINVETIRVFFVNMSLRFFEGRANTVFHFVKKCSLERLAKKGIALCVRIDVSEA